MNKKYDIQNILLRIASIFIIILVARIFMEIFYGKIQLAVIGILGFFTTMLTALIIEMWSEPILKQKP